MSLLPGVCVCTMCDRGPHGPFIFCFVECMCCACWHGQWEKVGIDSLLILGESSLSTSFVFVVSFGYASFVALPLIVHLPNIV